MATLTETAYHSRRIVRFAIFAMIGYIALRIFLVIGSGIIDKIRTPAPPEADPVFHKIPPLQLPENAGLPELTYKLETIEGNKLPVFEPLINVYFIPQNIYTYSTFSRAKANAAKLGFKEEPQKLDETTYRWDNLLPYPESLTMDIVNNNFKYHYSYDRNPSLINISQLMTEEVAIEAAVGYFVNAGYLPGDIQRNKAEVIYYRLYGNQLRQVPSIVDADFYRVNFQRVPMEKKYPFVVPDPAYANISALVTKNKKQRIVEAKRYYFEIDKEVFGSYPLKNSADAWNELKSGQGYIASLGENQDGQVTIRNIFLGYYDPPEPQLYLQPVYVFSGDRNFQAYVPAVSEKWIETQAQEE